MRQKRFFHVIVQFLRQRNIFKYIFVYVCALSVNIFETY